MNKKIENKVDKYLKNGKARMYKKHNLMKKEILIKEQKLNTQCTSLWEQTNRLGEKYLYGLFNDTVIALGCFNKTVNMFLPNDNRY